MQDLNCELTWGRRRGLEIKHPVHGTIRPKVIGQCPLIGEAQALELIKELETKRVEDLQRSTAAMQRTLWLWDQGCQWSRHVEVFLDNGSRGAQLLAMEAEDSPFVDLPSTLKGSLAEDVVLTEKAGWNYLKALPVSRRKRKQLMSSPWVLNLFAGSSENNAELKVLEDGAVLVEMDILRSKAFDFRRTAGAYRAVLWAAATGRIKGTMASPPMRTGADEELLAKTMWCSVVSKAARAARNEPPPFLMIEGAKVMSYMEAGKVHDQPTGLQRTWPRYLDTMGIEAQYDSMVSNLDYEPTTMTTSSRTGRWTTEFKEETVKAINRWLWAPDFKQKAKWMARMDAGSFLESLSDKELEQWRVHLRNNHIPYNRKCKTCVESSGTGRRHVKIKTPSSYCLSLDVCGPFRKRGADPDHSDYRFALVGAYVIPKLLREVRDGGPHRDEVRDGGPHRDEVRDGGPHKDEVRDGGPHRDEVRDGGPHKDEVRDGGPHKHEVRDGGPHRDEVRDGGPDQHEEGLSDSAVPIYGGDFEPEVSEDTGFGLGPLQEWQEGELFEDGDVVNPSAEEELRLPKGMSEEEFKEVFSQVGGVEGYQVIYVSSVLRSRTTKDVLAAVQDLYLRLRAHGCPILRVHSDRARELRSDPLRRWLASHGTYTTYTEGQSPQANGRAEAAVKYAKIQTKRLLTAGNFAPRLWPMALRYAMWAQMQRQLYPEKKLIPFGTRVHVRKKVYGTGGRYDLESRWGTGYYLGPSADVNEGSVIMMDKGNFITTAHMRPGLLDVDREVELEDYQALVSIPSRRLRRKSTLDPGDFEGVPQLPPPDDDEEGTRQPAYDPNDPVEEYARAVLKESRIDRDLVESLARLLPTDGKKPSRFGDQSDDECIWASGAFVHGGVVGILNNTRKYPLATKVFVSYLKDQCPGFKCNSVAVFKGIKAKPHKDARNVGINAVVPLTDFEGCDVMVKKGEKTVALKVSEGPQFFDPHDEHYTTSCTKGTSLMLVGYSVRDSAKLKEEMVSFLMDLGFIWDPHRASEGRDQGEALRMAMMKKAQAQPEKSGESVHGGRPRDGGLDHVNADLDVAIGDLEDRAARLRDLLEEEEIMVEQANRLGQVLRSELGDARDYVCKYLPVSPGKGLLEICEEAGQRRPQHRLREVVG